MTAVELDPGELLGLMTETEVRRNFFFTPSTYAMQRNQHDAHVVGRFSFFPVCFINKSYIRRDDATTAISYFPDCARASLTRVDFDMERGWQTLVAGRRRRPAAQGWRQGGAGGWGRGVLHSFVCDCLFIEYPVHSFICDCLFIEFTRTRTRSLARHTRRSTEEMYVRVFLFYG